MTAAPVPNRFTTDRGFIWFDKFEDRNGMTVAVAESSAAGLPHAWIHLDPDSGRGSSAHLNRSQVVRVRDALNEWLLRHGVESLLAEQAADG